MRRSCGCVVSLARRLAQFEGGERSFCEAVRLFGCVDGLVERIGQQ